jgi:hypothetical protein
MEGINIPKSSRKSMTEKKREMPASILLMAEPLDVPIDGRKNR